MGIAKQNGRAHRWVLFRQENWCVEDEGSTVLGPRYSTQDEAIDAAVRMVRAVGSGIVYVRDIDGNPSSVEVKRSPPPEPRGRPLDQDQT